MTKPRKPDYTLTLDIFDCKHNYGPQLTFGVHIFFGQEETSRIPGRISLGIDRMNGSPKRQGRALLWLDEKKGMPVGMRVNMILSHQIISSFWEEQIPAFECSGVLIEKGLNIQGVVDGNCHSKSFMSHW